MRRALAAGALILAVGCASTPDATVKRAVPSRPVAELVASLGDPDQATRARAAWGLVGADAGDPLVARALIAALDDPERPVREAAAWTIGNLNGTLQGAPDASLPRLVTQTKPVYPLQAFNKKVEGMVVVRMLIGEDGRVVHAETRKSVRGLDAAALTCVRAWVFTPGQRNGRPVATVAEAPVTFRIY